MDIKLKSGETLNINGEVIASTFSKTNGTSSQFLKADGSVDSNSYATTSQLSEKQDTLVSGTNIKTVNGASLLGSGNLHTGNVFEAGTGGTNSVQQKGTGAAAGGHDSVAEGSNTLASGMGSHAEGANTVAQNLAEHASGYFNVSNKSSDTFGSSGNTSFSHGIGTGYSARKNAFEIMENGDAYLYGVGGYDGTNGGSAGVGSTQSVINGKVSANINNFQIKVVSSQSEVGSESNILYIVVPQN